MFVYRDDICRERAPSASMTISLAILSSFFSSFFFLSFSFSRFGYSVSSNDRDQGAKSKGGEIFLAALSVLSRSTTGSSAMCGGFPIAGIR